MRVVLDSNTLVSALLFSGPTNFLVDLWQEHQIKAIASHETINGFSKVIRYPKFRLSESQISTVKAAYLPYVLVVDACKMATGSGKTTVMGMLSAWSILNRIAAPNDDRFSDTILIVWPNVTIRFKMGCEPF